MPCATSRIFVMKRTYSNYGDSCFSDAGPKLWISLPADLRQADIIFQLFKRLRKTFLFGCRDCGALWLTVKAAPYKFSLRMWELIDRWLLLAGGAWTWKTDAERACCSRARTQTASWTGPRTARGGRPRRQRTRALEVSYFSHQVDSLLYGSALLIDKSHVGSGAL